MEQADGVGRRVVRAEGVGADELGEAVGLVRLRAADRAHLVQDHGHAAPGDLPGGLRPGEAAPDDVDRLGGAHVPEVASVVSRINYILGFARRSTRLLTK